MAVPKKRTSKRRKGMRRANDYLTFSERVTTCSNCGSDVLLHHVCENCGYYKGKKVIEGKEDISSSVVDDGSFASEESSVDDAPQEETQEETPEEETRENETREKDIIAQSPIRTP